jgi:hypothetical protein
LGLSFALVVVPHLSKELASYARPGAGALSGAAFDEVWAFTWPSDKENRREFDQKSAD